MFRRLSTPNPSPGRDDSNNGDSNDGDEPWVAKILDSIADVWHVVIPITDDVTSAWLLASATSSSAAADGGGGVAGVGPLWWVCLAALVAAGAERAWLLAALAATAAVVPLMWLSQAALAAMSWCARLCAVSPACTVCCLLSICCCCAPCLAVASARGGARGWGSTAARLFARMTGARAAAAAAAAGAKRHRNGAPAPPPTTGGGHPNILLFSDALLWAVVGSRARCSRFWDGLGLCLDGAGAKPRDGGGDSCGGEGEAAFGSVVDVWVDFHPFGWLGRAVFGRRPLPMGSSFWGRWCSCSCCGQGEGRKPSGAGTGGGGAAASARGSNDTSSSSGYNDAGEGPGDEESPPLPPPPPPPPAPPSRSSPRRRRRGRVLVRAVGETLVVDGLFLALSATAGGGWDGSLTGIAGMSGLFSALQLLAGLRYYVREASDALEQVDRPDRDVGGGGGWKGSGADEDSSEGWSSASGSDRFSFGEEGSVSSSEQSSVFGQKGVGGFERVSAPAIYPGDSGQEPVWVGQAVSNV